MVENTIVGLSDTVNDRADSTQNLKAIQDDNTYNMNANDNSMYSPHTSNQKCKFTLNQPSISKGKPKNHGTVSTS